MTTGITYYLFNNSEALGSNSAQLVSNKNVVNTLNERFNYSNSCALNNTVATATNPKHPLPDAAVRASWLN